MAKGSKRKKKLQYEDFTNTAAGLLPEHFFTWENFAPLKLLRLALYIAAAHVLRGFWRRLVE